MHDFKFKKRLVIGFLVLLLLADAGLAYFNMKMAGPRGNRDQDLASQSRKLALVKADVAHASEIRDKIPKTLARFDEIESGLLPASKGYSVITQEMSEYARDTHLIMDEVRFHEKDMTGRNLTELTVESRVSGDYSGIVHFLNHLQRSKNFYIVDALALETAPAGQPGQAPAGVLRVSLHVRTYFRKA
jgi:type IV pilus assembly protein PilO